MTRNTDGFFGDVDVMLLKAIQSTATEQLDQRIVVHLQETAAKHAGPVQLQSALARDGTNACAFISVKIADTFPVVFAGDLPRKRLGAQASHPLTLSSVSLPSLLGLLGI